MAIYCKKTKRIACPHKDKEKRTFACKKTRKPLKYFHTTFYIKEKIYEKDYFDYVSIFVDNVGNCKLQAKKQYASRRNS